MAIAAEIHVKGWVIAKLGPDLVVPWWSFTKTVIAAAALALVRDGALALDEPLDGQDYTLRHLLQHRAGFDDYGALPDYHAAVARGDAPWTPDDMLRRADAMRLRYAPGTGWRYSNIGTLMVRRLIERTTGEDLDGALRRLVLKPLGIDARVAMTPSDLEGVAMGAAAGYHPGWVYHGLMVGPLMEAALLLNRLMTSDFLSRALLADMTAGHALYGLIPGRPWLRPSYGLGLMIDGADADGPRGHTGGGPGSVIAVYRTGTQTGAAFAFGSDEGEVERAAMTPSQSLGP